MLDESIFVRRLEEFSTCLLMKLNLQFNVFKFICQINSESWLISSIERLRNSYKRMKSFVESLLSSTSKWIGLRRKQRNEKTSVSIVTKTSTRTRETIFIKTSRSISRETRSRRREQLERRIDSWIKCTSWVSRSMRSSIFVCCWSIERASHSSTICEQWMFKWRALTSTLLNREFWAISRRVFILTWFITTTNDMTSWRRSRYLIQNRCYEIYWRLFCSNATLRSLENYEMLTKLRKSIWFDLHVEMQSLNASIWMWMCWFYVFEIARRWISR